MIHDQWPDLWWDRDISSRFQTFQWDQPCRGRRLHLDFVLSVSQSSWIESDISCWHLGNDLCNDDSQSISKISQSISTIQNTEKEMRMEGKGHTTHHCHFLHSCTVGDRVDLLLCSRPTLMLRNDGLKQSCGHILYWNMVLGPVLLVEIFWVFWSTKMSIRKCFLDF